MFSKLTRTLFICIILVLGGSTSAQEEDVERHVKAAYVYQFTKLVKWPEKKEGDFVIYVIEDQELMKVLNGVVADRTVGGRKIKVVLGKWAEVVLNPGDIVIFPKNESSFHKAVIEKLKTKPCLVVSFSPGLAAAGATVNFFLSDDRIKFELNLKSLKEKALTADPTLVKLAKIVG